MGEGWERLTPEDLIEVRRQAKVIHWRALLATVVYTAAALLIP